MKGPVVSPYSLADTLRWPVRYVKPSIHRRSQLTARPAAHEFGNSGGLEAEIRQTETREAETPEPALRLLFFGDLMCMPGDRVPRVSPELRALVEAADFVIGNCEAPVTPDPPRPDARYAFTFRMSEAYLAAFLERLGAEPARCALSVANNHAADRGPDGFETTLDCLGRLGVRPLGARGARSAPDVVEVGGVPLALTAWTQWMNREVFPRSRGPWRSGEVEPRAPADRSRGAGSDPGTGFRIGLPHWDHEFCHYPAPGTRRRALACLDSGFDLLVGHHPHVIQPIEWAGGGVCAYSLGNLNGPPLLLRAPSTRLVGIFEVELTVSDGRPDGVGSRKPILRRYRLHPFVQVRETGGMAIVPLAAAPPGLRRRLDRRMGRLFPDAPGAVRQ